MIMRILLLLPALNFGAVADPASFSGAFGVEKKLEERLVRDGESLHLETYTSDPGLSYLLGVWTGFGPEHAFSNATPNSVNTLIWQTTISSLADDISAGCAHKSKLKANPDFAARLAAICKWPQNDAKSEAVMHDFWKALLSEDAPESEFRAWREFFLHSSFKDQPSSRAVSALVQAALMNPYFLVRQ